MNLCTSKQVTQEVVDLMILSTTTCGNTVCVCVCVCLSLSARTPVCVCVCY